MSDIDFGVNLATLRDENLATYRHYKPLSSAADEFVREAQDGRRIFTGIPQLDAEMRGLGAGHLLMLVGHSHQGKTLVFLRMLQQNKDKRIILFIPDEPTTLVLAKLASIEHRVEAKDLEHRVANDDIEAIQLLRSTADLYPNLIVYDGSMDAVDMEHAYEEACDVWGTEPDMVAFDYLDLLQVGETVPAKADWVKAWGRRHNLPICLLHQTSRSSGANGQKMTLTSGAYGGEAHATFMVGVRRKKYQVLAEIAEQEERLARASQGSTIESARERIESLQRELRIHEYTITVSLVKNKRPGGGLVDDIDFELETGTGRLLPLGAGDLPRAYREQLSTHQVETLRREIFDPSTDTYEQLEIAS